MALSLDLIAVLLLFASIHSGLPIPENVQPFIAVTEYFEGYRLGKNGEWRGGPDGGPFYAVTSSQTGHIGLHAQWIDDANGKCILAHELTHYLQWVNYKLTRSDRDNEPIAYEVSAACFTRYNMPNAAKWAKERVIYYLLN